MNDRYVGLFLQSHLISHAESSYIVKLELLHFPAVSLMCLEKRGWWYLNDH